MTLPNLREIAIRSNKLAIQKGWWKELNPNDPNIQLAKLMLAVTELCEAAECARDAELAMKLVDGKPEGFVVECADAIICIADLCQAMGLDLAEALEAKHAFNETRTHRHGGRLA